MAGQTDDGVSALIVAQSGSWRDALLAMLEEIPQIETIHLVRDTASALRSAAAYCPDLVLLDTNLPGDHRTASFPHKLETVCPCTRLLVLTNVPPGPDRPPPLSNDAVPVKGCSATVLFQVLESLLPDGSGNS